MLAWRFLTAACLVALGVASWAGEALAQRGYGRGGGERMEAKHPPEYYRAKGMFATGLKPVFPDGTRCPGISSPFGSPTRYDGSARSNDHHGVHGGLDISLDTGTPLLAVADGTVIHAGTGGLLVGNYVWVHLPPAATRLPVHAFAKYQHLDRPTELKPGDRVRKGDVIGLSGNTGTVGGYYGSLGYAHLHLTIQIADDGEFVISGSTVVPKDANFLDPVGLYVAEPTLPFDNHRLHDRSDAREVPTAVKLADGRVVPPDAPVIWPVACVAQ